MQKFQYRYKRNVFRLVCFGLLLTCMPLTLCAQKQLTILHTSDTHSCILPLNENLADTLFAGRAGFIRRIAMLEEERKQDPELLLFDSGDFSQGSPYYTLFKGDVEIGLMNRMHHRKPRVRLRHRQHGSPLQAGKLPHYLLQLRLSGHGP